MNDTTLPITSKKKNPRIRRTDKGVRRGFGLHDWMNLLRRSKDIAQRKGAPLRKDITLSEVQSHNKPCDGWVILRGKVYNIAPYLAYHPGGIAILEKALGEDATPLFDKYHAWVNIENLIGPLLLGYLLVEKKKGDNEENYVGYLKGMTGNGLSTVNENSGDGDIVVPAGAAPTASLAPASNSNDLEFTMPKPRPPKGRPISSLLMSNNMTMTK